VKIYRSGILTELIVPPEIPENQVMNMHVFTRYDPAFSKPNDLAIFPHRCTILDFTQRHFVTRSYLLCDLQANTVSQQFLALEHWPLKDSDRVVRMKDDGGLLEARLSHAGNARRFRVRRQITGPRVAIGNHPGPGALLLRNGFDRAS
jgi:hypothetical protein